MNYWQIDIGVLVRFMPCLKYMIANANTTELRMLRGKTIECVSLIGLAVGAEKFTADASEVLKGEFSNFHRGPSRFVLMRGSQITRSMRGLGGSHRPTPSYLRSPH